MTDAASSSPYELLASTITLGIAAFGLIMIVAGVDGAKRVAQALGRVVTRGVRFAVRLAASIVLSAAFTAVDALITLALIAYQTATGRPWMAGDSWVAFTQRLNDRIHRTLLH